MTDEELSQREKRRQQHEHSKPKLSVNAGALKKWAWPLGLALLVGGIVTAMVVTDNAAGECPGHWHGAYTVVVDGQEVRYTNPAFSSADNTWASGTHIHGDDGVYHFHPAVEKCTSWNDAMRNLGTTISSSELVLSDQHGSRAGTYDGAPIRVYEQKWSEQDDSWQQISNIGKFLKNQPANGDGLVVLFGDYTDEEIAALLESANTMKGNPSYDPHFAA